MSCNSMDSVERLQSHMPRLWSPRSRYSSLPGSSCCYSSHASRRSRVLENGIAAFDSRTRAQACHCGSKEFHTLPRFGTSRKYRNGPDLAGAWRSGNSDRWDEEEMVVVMVTSSSSPSSLTLLQ